MKKISILILITFLLTLTACSAVSSGAEPALAPQTEAPSGELPATTQLILGTFKLEETGQAVTAEQAAELLPLWQTLQVLSESDTAADQETQALIAQIQETMTAEQKQAITGMNLTREDMLSLMQEQGLAMGTGGQSSTSQGGNSSNSTNRNFGPGGGMPPPDGGFPGGGSGFGGQGQNLSAEQIATAQAARQAGGGNRIPTPLLNALIEFLKQKAGSL
jgi:hypothetical protein